MNNFTGNAEICIDISETLLTLLLPFLNSSLSDTGKSTLISKDTAEITYNFTKLVISDQKARGVLSFDVTCTPTIQGTKLAPMTGSANLSVPFRITPPDQNNKCNLVLDFTDPLSVGFYGVLTNIEANATALGWTTTGYTGVWNPQFLWDTCEASIRSLICGKVNHIVVSSFDVVTNFPFNGSISKTTITFARNGLILTSLPATSSRHGVLSVLGAISFANISQINPLLKNVAAIDGEHDLGLALSQQGYHDRVFCPTIAENLGIDTTTASVSPPGVPVFGMCPDCGLAGSVPLESGLDLHTVSTALAEGQANLAGVAVQTFGGGSATAVFDGHTTFALDSNSNVVPNTVIDQVQVGISLEWWAVLLSIISLGSLDLFAIYPADKLLAPVVKSMAQSRLDSLITSLQLPMIPIPGLKINSIALHPGVMVIMGQSAFDQG